MSRREFIKAAGVTLASGVLLAIGGRLLMDWRLPQVSGWALRRSTFASHLNETFQVRQGAATLPLQLVDVRDLPAIGRARTSEELEQSFALLFRGSGAVLLNQGTYTFERAEIESYSLFIVPMRAEEGASYYEAIFNRQQA
jgi:hypothetical protein